MEIQIILGVTLATGLLSLMALIAILNLVLGLKKQGQVNPAKQLEKLVEHQVQEQLAKPLAKLEQAGRQVRPKPAQPKQQHQPAKAQVEKPVVPEESLGQAAPKPKRRRNRRKKEQLISQQVQPKL